MSHAEEMASVMKVPPMPDEFCGMHQSHESCLKSIDAKLGLILDRIGQGDTQFATLELRLKSVEKKTKWLAGVVFGIGSLFSVAIIGALIKLVVMDGK